MLLALAAPAGAQLSWSGPILRDTAGRGPSLTTVACSSAGQCIALDRGGGEVTFDPAAPVPAVGVRVDSTGATAATCPSSSRCVAVDIAGQVVSFDPSSPTSAVSAAVDPSSALTGVSCPPGASVCVAVDVSGNVVTFDPAKPASAAVTPVDPGQPLVAVSCYLVDTCVAIDPASQVTFRLAHKVTVTGKGTLETNSSTFLTALTCASASQCVAFDGAGAEIAFTTGGTGTTTVPGFDKGHVVTGATCTSETQCVALDSDGGELTFSPGGRSSSPATRVAISTAGMTAPVCPTATRCLAGDGTGHVLAFDPTATPPVATRSLVDGSTTFSAIACPAANQCTATDGSGDAVTFDPGSPAGGAAAPVDPAGGIIYGIACPAATQCTAVDAAGNEVTFDPTAPGSPAPVQVVKGHPLLAIDCPSSTQCTAVDDDRFAVTFNPRAPSSPAYAALGTPAQASLIGVACAAVDQCTALAGSGDAVTFDPGSGRVGVPAGALPNAAGGVACPTARECVALDDAGNRATFDPSAAGLATMAHLDSVPPGPLACPTATHCVEVDSAGRAIEFDPAGSGSIATEPVPTTGALTDLACPGAGLCVAVDSTGRAFLATGLVPPPPAANAPPTIVGTLLQGITLHAGHATWSELPTSYAYEWERCDASGSACVPIRGASTQTYAPTLADGGHALRVIEIASDAGGTSGPAVSAPSRPVALAPTPAVLSGGELRHLPRGLAALSLTITAGIGDPAIGSFTIALPRGLSFTTRPARSVTVRVHGRAVRSSVRVRRGTLTVRLGRPAGSLRLELGRLRETTSLARSRRRLPVVVTITAGARARLRSSLQLRP